MYIEEEATTEFSRLVARNFIHRLELSEVKTLGGAGYRRADLLLAYEK